MGLFLSVVISYAGVREALQCVRHIQSGIIPDEQPNFEDLIEYYTTLLRKSTQLSNSWIDNNQGFLSLTEDKDGNLKSAAVKFYTEQPNSTALLFSTKISSFGQESVEDNAVVNGDYKTERYSPSKTKTIITNNHSEPFSVDGRDRSPVANHVNHSDDTDADKEKLTWTYRPLDPPATPEIHFESYDDDKAGVYNEDFLRSLDGIKHRPIQRQDPSGRRRSFKKRWSSSSNSSRESRASREEELQMFTSLEEAEFERMNKQQDYGSAPNLSARSHSRSRSRERRNESSEDGPGDNEVKQRSDLPKMNSFEEQDNKEVIEEEGDVDFWGGMGD